MPFINIFSIFKKFCNTQMFLLFRLMWAMSLVLLFLPSVIQSTACQGCDCNCLVSGTTGVQYLTVGEFAHSVYRIQCCSHGAFHCPDNDDYSLTVSPTVPGMTLSSGKRNKEANKVEYLYEGIPTTAGTYEVTITGSYDFYTKKKAGKKRNHTCHAVPISCTYIVSEPE